MPIGEKQRLITNIVSIILGEDALTNITFDWFVNKHLKKHFRNQHSTIEMVFNTLNGDILANQNKRITLLQCDAYFGGEYNFMFEFDEFQHFSTSRLITLDLYPKDIEINYPIELWRDFCLQNKVKADKYRQNKVTIDFNFSGGRTSQRAYLDCFRDILPKNNGLNPTLRISEFEVLDIHSNSIENCKKIEKILNKRLKI